MGKSGITCPEIALYQKRSIRRQNNKRSYYIVGKNYTRKTGQQFGDRKTRKEQFLILSPGYALAFLRDLPVFPEFSFPADFPTRYCRGPWTTKAWDRKTLATLQTALILSPSLSTPSPLSQFLMNLHSPPEISLRNARSPGILLTWWAISRRCLGYCAVVFSITSGQ